jgi:MFS family permease
MLVPVNGLGTSELEARIGETQRAEAFSCLQAATMIGGGIGAVLNGILAPLGAWKVPFITVGLFSLLAVGLAVAARLADRRSRPAKVAVPRRSLPGSGWLR